MNDRVREDETPINVKIAMFGGPRAGKTSLLASMYERIAGEVNDAGLDIVQADPAKSIILEDAVDRLRNLHNTVEKNPLLEGVGVSATQRQSGDEDRDAAAFDFILSGASVDVATLSFYDFSGEDIRSYAKHVQDGLVSADIVLVAIDAPFMVEAAADPDFFALHKRRNLSEQFDGLVREWRGHKPAAVLFCPIKCERWTRSDGAELEQAFRKLYRSTLARFEKGFDETDVIFAPVETVGSVAYDGLRAYDPNRSLEPSNAVPAYQRIEGAWAPRYFEQPFRWILLSVTRAIDFGIIANAEGGGRFQTLMARTGHVYDWTGLPRINMVERFWNKTSGLKAFLEATATLAEGRLLDAPYAVLKPGPMTSE